MEQKSKGLFFISDVGWDFLSFYTEFLQRLSVIYSSYFPFLRVILSFSSIFEPKKGLTAIQIGAFFRFVSKQSRQQRSFRLLTLP